MTIDTQHKRLDDSLRHPDLADDVRDVIECCRRSAGNRGEKLTTVADLARYAERLFESNPGMLAALQAEMLAQRMN